MGSLVPPYIAAGKLSGMAQPRLHTEGITLRPWCAEDAPAIVAAYADPEIRRWHVRSMDLDEALAWAQSWQSGWLEESAASWAVVDADDRLLGRTGVQGLSLAGGSGHIAYWMVPAARGRGIAPRALEVVTEWAFAELGLHRLILGHSVQNNASCRVAEKSGYVLEGTARGNMLHADGWHDAHVHARLAATPTAAMAVGVER